MKMLLVFFPPSRYKFSGSFVRFQSESRVGLFIICKAESLGAEVLKIDLPQKQYLHFYRRNSSYLNIVEDCIDRHNLCQDELEMKGKHSGTSEF